jgi:hypothetical protein
MADENQRAAEVDETPISPIQRRDSLEKHLQHRPNAQDLKNRNILLNTNAAPLVLYHLAQAHNADSRPVLSRQLSLHWSARKPQTT